MPITPKTPTKALAPNLYNTVGTPRRYVRGAGPRFDTETNFWAYVDPTAGAQLRRAGVSIQADPTLFQSGGSNPYNYRHIGGQFDPVTNVARYSPYASGLVGVMQHEIVHAAQTNIAPTMPLVAGKGSGDLGRQWRAFGIQQGIRATGQGNLLSGALRLPSVYFGVGPAGGLLEGQADRSGAYNYPRWGESFRRMVIPNPAEGRNYTYP